MKMVDLSKYDNSWYNPGNKIKILIWYFINLLFFKTSIPYPSKIKVLLLRIFGAKIGKNVVIKPCVNIKYPWFLKIGDNVWIGENVWIDNLTNVEVGNNVCISQGAYIFTGNHNYKTQTFDLIIKPVIIEDGVWIGAKAIVCPGVRCKSHSVLSVGSVATKDLEEYTVYQGNPADPKRKRTIDDRA